MNLIGSDIEYAVLDNANKFVPAGVLPCEGKKGKPEKLTYGGVEIDCCGIEIAPPPANTPKEFASNILSLLGEVREKFKTHTLHAKASVIFPAKVLKEVRYANEMGCDPDYNAWTKTVNPRPIADATTMRSFGGHVHIEGGSPVTVVACDVLLGLWSTLKDTDKERRKLYGKSGAFREKSYGVEYRVLSNFWAEKREDMEYVWHMADIARRLSVEGIRELLEIAGGELAVRRYIDSGTPVDASTYERVVARAQRMVG